MDREQPIKLREGLVARSFEDETVVLDLRTSTYLKSNPTGTVIWHALEQGATKSEIVAALLSEFDVTPQLAASDVDRFVEACTTHGYLSESPDPAGVEQP